MSPLVITLRRMIIRVWTVNWHLIKGVVSLRLGRLSGARNHFRRVVDINPDCYRARVALGQIHFHFLEVREGLVQFEHARRVDPTRFEKSGLQKIVQSYELDETLYEERREAPLFVNFRSEPETDSPFPSTGDAWDLDSLFDPAPNDAGIDSPQEPDQPPGDFSSLKEYVRFKDLPPITRDEIEDIDWNKINSDLFD